MSALALLVALALDCWWGEPRVRLHPVVWMGNYLGWAGQHLQRLARQTPQTSGQVSASGSLTFASDFKAFWLGALYWIAGAAIVLVMAWTLQHGVMALPQWLGPVPGSLLAALLLGFLLKPMLAWVMLKDEVLAVEKALAPEHGGSLAQGRERLSWLVSRDVTQLTEAQVRESAIETLAENLNDSVVAPIFWFVLFGLPGAALYRFANTADAMWGYRGVYKGQNWEWAGKWAARADDVLSWLPARISAYLLVAVCWIQSLASTRSQPIAVESTDQSGADVVVVVARLPQEAARTPSPNSGWPMAAMALVLGVCLHKPGVYALNPTGRTPQFQDTKNAISYASKSLVALVFIVQVAMLFVVTRGLA